ncbi:MAG: hypothetical protein ACON35_05000 [Candidatus Marinamargulisbacteria bacterium]
MSLMPIIVIDNGNLAKKYIENSECISKLNKIYLADSLLGVMYTQEGGFLKILHLLIANFLIMPN